MIKDIDKSELLRKLECMIDEYDFAKADVIALENAMEVVEKAGTELKSTVRQRDVIRWWRELSNKEREELVRKYFGNDRDLWQVDHRISDVIKIYRMENEAAE